MVLLRNLVNTRDLSKTPGDAWPRSHDHLQLKNHFLLLSALQGTILLFVLCACACVCYCTQMMYVITTMYYTVKSTVLY